jgi:hypothetical protein
MWFAECFFSGTRQRSSLPLGKKTLGKEAVLPSAKKTLGKDILCRVPKKHSAKKLLCRVQKNTRQFFWHSAKQFFKTHFKALNEFKLKSF